IAGAVLVLLVAVAFVLAASQPQMVRSVASGTGGAAGIAALLGLSSFLKLKDSNSAAAAKIEHAGTATAQRGSGTGLFGSVGGAVEPAEDAFVKAFERGYEQMRIELDGLNRSIAVTYPLVEFFARMLKLDSKVDFLTGIFWSGTKREEELGRIIRAAFGALAL